MRTRKRVCRRWSRARAATSRTPFRPARPPTGTSSTPARVSDNGGFRRTDTGANLTRTAASDDGAHSRARRTRERHAHGSRARSRRFCLDRHRFPTRTFAMTNPGASLHATPRACGACASRHAWTGRRIRALSPRAPNRPATDTTTRASTAWTLDGPGCAGARSGSTLVGYGRLPSGANNAAPVDARGPPRRCPLRPVAISDLCESHFGRFKMLDAVFEQEGDILYVRHADRARHEDGSGANDAVGYVPEAPFSRAGVSRGNFGTASVVLTRTDDTREFFALFTRDGAIFLFAPRRSTPLTFSTFPLFAARASEETSRTPPRGGPPSARSARRSARASSRTRDARSESFSTKTRRSSRVFVRRREIVKASRRALREATRSRRNTSACGTE